MRFSIIISFLLITLYSSSQDKLDLQFNRYTLDDGLSNSESNDIVQDKQGFIWISTEDGLNRFDSYNFKVYRKVFNDSNSIAHSKTTDLFIDSKNNLWIGTQVGISRYNPELDNFINYSFPIKDTIMSNEVLTIAENKTGDLFVSLQYGKIYMLDRQKNIFIEKLAVNKTIQDIFIDSNDKLWILSDTIFIYDKNIKPFKTITVPSLKYGFNKIVEDTDQFWIGTGGSGLLWLDNKNYTISRVFKSGVYEDYITEISKDNKNNIWIGTANSLKLYNKKNDRFYYYYHEKNNPKSLMSSGIRRFFQDKDDNYWALVPKEGINIAQKRKQFINLKTEQEYDISLSKRTISSLLIDSNNNIWAGSYHAGIDIINLENKTVKTLENILADKTSLGAGSVLMLHKDVNNDIWVGTYRGGLQKYNNKTGGFINFTPNPNDSTAIVGEDIRSATGDKDGNMWFATSGTGLEKYNVAEKRFTQYRHLPESSRNQITGDWLFSVICSNDGNIWIGSSFGLSVFNPHTEQFSNYFNSVSDSTSLSNNFINCIFEDSDQNIWIGTNEGLNLFNKEQENFTHFLPKDGLVNPVIKSIEEDRRGRLWLSTNKGISCFDKEKKEIYNFSIEHGIASNEFNDRASAQLEDGFILFGGNNGITGFYPDSIFIDSIIHPIFITDFKILNKSIYPNTNNSPLKKDIIHTKELTLTHTQASVISFQFTSVNYIESEKRKYAYMMEGFDNEWVYCGQKREVTYTNLDPGEYTFRVKASNHDNIWDEQGISITVIILPPWWKTIGFRIIAFLFIAGLFTLFYILKIRSLRQQQRLLEKMVEERTKEIHEKNLKLTSLNATKDKFFTIIAHDLKNPFNAILGLSDLLKFRYKKLTDEKREKMINTIHQSSNNLYKLLENLLQWARSQTGAIEYNPAIFPLNDMVESNADIVKDMIAKKGLALSWEIDDKLQVYADINMITTVIRNLLSNAIKFMDSGEIKITGIKQEGYALISIKDSGIGISKDKLPTLFEVEGSKSTKGTNGESGTGLGLIICKEFVEANGGTISVESEEGKGTCFTFTIPIKE